MTSPVPFCVVFYAGLVYGEYSAFPHPLDLPEGAYLYSIGGASDGQHWYSCNRGYTGIQLGVVPMELRTLVLLMS